MLARQVNYVLLIALLNNLLINLIVLFLLFLLFSVKSTVILAVFILLFFILQNEAPLLVRWCIVAVIFVIIVLLALVFINGFWNDFIVLGLILAGLPSRLRIQAHLSSIPQWSWLFLFLKDTGLEATSDYLAVLLIWGPRNNFFRWLLSIKGATQILGLAARCVVSIRFVLFIAFIHYCRFVLATLGLPNFFYIKGEKVISYSWFCELCASLWCFSNTDCLLLKGYYHQK